MSTPGFSAELSLSGKSLTHGTRGWTGPSGTRVIPALPIGGWGTLACIRAICRISPTDCSSAWRICVGNAPVDPWLAPLPNPGF